MLNVPENVRQHLIKVIPASYINEIACFVFFDNHPQDENNIDVIICTFRGEIVEFYQRIVVCSILLESSEKPTNLTLLRNSKCNLFYLVFLESELLILSRNNTLQIHKKINDVDSYEVVDKMCNGQAFLRILCKDDAVPQIFDDNIENMNDVASTIHQNNDIDMMPVILDIKRKFSQARYNVKSYEKSYNDLLHLRQSLVTSVGNTNSSDVSNSDKEQHSIDLKTQKPWVKVCNRKIVVVLQLLNKHIIPMKDVYVLLHCTAGHSITYVTKLFESTFLVPYWTEKKGQNIEQNCETAVVTVVDLKEIKNNINSTIKFQCVLCYKKQDKEFLFPLENVTISAIESMGEELDVLHKSPESISDNKEVFLSVLATSEKVDLCLRHIIDKTELKDFDITDVFVKYLQMEKIENGCKVFIHRTSPYHTLHGSMVIVKPVDEMSNKDTYKVSVYVRESSQVLSLINLIHDAVPFRIVTTTADQIITAKHDELSRYNENSDESSSNLNYLSFGTSILNQSVLMMDYLDTCMIKMNESKNSAVQMKVGSEIDIFAAGATEYLQLRKNVLIEADKGIQSIVNSSTSCDNNSEEIMTID